MNEKSFTERHHVRTHPFQDHLIHPDDVLVVRQRQLPQASILEIAAFFALLKDPTRLHVLYALLHAPSGEIAVSDLAAALERDDTTISHQLRVLRAQRIVTTRRVGRILFYRIIDEHIRALLELILSHVQEERSSGEQKG
jgi:DNA-binding transcriptional ArsR family regulator